MKTIVQVNLKSRHGAREFSIIETAYTTFDRFLADVENDVLIRGVELRTIPGDVRGHRKVIGRTPIAFRGDEVDGATLPYWTFQEGTSRAA